MDKKDKIELLKSEYFKLQDYYESFDTKVQTVKGWSATVSIAAITVGFSYKNEFIWLFAAVTALMFWFMDAKWKFFQYCYAPRIVEIENAFTADNFDTIIPLQIYFSWFKEWKSGKLKLKKIFFMKIVMLPYAYTVAVCLLLFILKFFCTNIFWSPQH